LRPNANPGTQETQCLGFPTAPISTSSGGRHVNYCAPLAPATRPLPLGSARRRKWSPATISAEDDRGCAYQYSFGGSAGRDGHEELCLRFRPRLDPLARRLRLTCTGSAEQIAVDLDLAD
jgi:hypothetical protein